MIYYIHYLKFPDTWHSVECGQNYCMWAVASESHISVAMKPDPIPRFPGLTWRWFLHAAPLSSSLVTEVSVLQLHSLVSRLQKVSSALPWTESFRVRSQNPVTKGDTTWALPNAAENFICHLWNLVTNILIILMILMFVTLYCIFGGNVFYFCNDRLFCNTVRSVYHHESYSHRSQEGHYRLFTLSPSVYILYTV